MAANVMESVAEEIRRPYVALIDSLGTVAGADMDWWVTALASRNTYACPLHRRLCHLVLARRLIHAGQVDEVVVDSPALAAAIARTSGKAVPVAGGRLRGRFVRWMGLLRRYAGALFHVANQWAFSRLLLPPSPRPPAESVVLVDTFFYAETVADGEIHDRHYPGMLDRLDAAERGRVFFAPSYYRIRNYPRFYRQLRRVRGRVILREDVLCFADYLFALLHPFRLRRPRGSIEFLGMDVGPLVREALAESCAGSGSIEGLLRYRFAQRLQEKGYRLQRVVEWFENQEIDHGANAGWRRFFPDTPVIGYQGFFASRHYLCMFPLTREAHLRLLPNRVAVMGPGLVEAAREFCPELEVETAPAFRFEAVWRERADEPDPGWFTVLVSLPILAEECRSILAMVRQLADEGQPGRCRRFVIKSHPAWSREDLAAVLGELPAGCSVVHADFATLLDRADALVSTASSTCVHAIARGIPVAVLGRPGTLLQNPIPAFADHSLWTACYTAADLCAALDRYADGDRSEVQRRRRIGQDFSERVFVPVTRQSVRRFLGFDEVELATA
ncbi:MAG TPA: hypothetical protein VI457_10120 [Methylococcaceae bacterium]|nr:hypothetical protein [Methylococcaceae bacterium]